jgi:hypothetical protein
VARTNKRRGLLMEARRFVRAAKDRIAQVYDAEESYDLALGEVLTLSNRLETWLDELIQTEDLEAEKETVRSGYNESERR